MEHYDEWTAAGRLYDRRVDSNAYGCAISHWYLVLRLPHFLWYRSRNRVEVSKLRKMSGSVGTNSASSKSIRITTGQIRERILLEGLQSW